MASSKTPPAIPADEVAEQLRRLGTELAGVADDVTLRTAKVRQIEEFLGNLRVGDYPELAESPVVQAFVNMLAPEGLRPGETRHRGTLAHVERDWTWDDCCREFKMVTFIPMESMPITWNGVGPIYIRAGEEVMLPDPFYSIYREHVYAQRQGQRHVNYLLGKSNQQPDPNWMNESSARVRANTDTGRGHYQPGGGMIYGAGEGTPEATEEKGA